MSEASLFFAIKSVDEEQRLVYGRATQEVLDRQGEVWDYEQSKPLWEEWISETEAASGGKSKGNLRSMHQGNVAAGKVVRVDFNDTEKAIDVCAKVVDDAEWAKVLEGVYTGFSQGGKYVKKWNDPAVKGFGGMPAVRVVIAPKELSLVDRPAVPTANFFEVVKCDGTTETRRFKAQGGEMSERADAPAEAGGEAKKGIWQGRRFLSVLEECNWLLTELKDERTREGDTSPIPEKLEACLGDLAGLCEEYIGEQLAELKAGGAIAAASEAVIEAEEGEKADTGTDAAKAANTGRKAKRQALMDAHKAYMDTYESCSKEEDEDTAKADAEVDAVKAAPLDVAAIAKEAAEKAVAAYIAASEDAAKAEALRRPAIRAVSKDEDAGKVEEVFDAAKAAHDATDPVSCFRALRANAGLDSTFHTIHTHH